MRQLISLGELFVWNSKLTVAKSMVYRFDFLSGILITIIFASIGPILQYLIFTQTRGFPGWTLEQIILFQGVMLLVLGLKGTVFGNVKNQFIQLVRNGDFDRLLLKPYSPIGVLLATSFSMDSIGTMFSGVVIIIYAVLKMHLIITVRNVLLFLFCLTAGLTFNVVIDILHCSFLMLTVADGGLQGIINAYLRFAEYPLEIYPKYLQLVFTVVFPLTIFIYYPTQVLLGRADQMVAIAGFSVFFLLVLSLKAWHLVLKKYTSAGG